MFFLCNGGALYAPYSYLSFSNMMCGGGEKRVVTLAAAYHPVFRVIIYGPWISQASVTALPTLTFNTFISIFNILIPFYKSPPPGEHNEVNRVRASNGENT